MLTASAGFSIFFHAAAGTLPPAFGCGIARTCVSPSSFSTAFSTTIPRFRCSQHWNAA